MLERGARLMPKTIKEIYWDGIRRQLVCMAHVNLLDQAWGYMTSQLYTYPESAKWYMMSTDVHFRAIEEECKVGEWDWDLMYSNYYVTRAGDLVGRGERLTVEEWLAFSDH